jgi:hypothetical protein
VNDPAHRLAQLAAALYEVGLQFLIIGGHAVRFYGVGRNTLDFDLHLSFPELSGLREVLGRASLFAGTPPAEGPSWRPRDFRRFVTGRLPDGREERLEVWRTNHLLAPFEEAYARKVEGNYGGSQLPFLCLPDLMRSKETERESDWQDLCLLEEIQDERLLNQAVDHAGQVRALAALRSRAGFDRSTARGIFSHPTVVEQALFAAHHPVTRAMLLPFAPNSVGNPSSPDALGEIASFLCRVQPGSARHLALVEVARRAWKNAAIEADRRDKLSAQS